MGNFVSIVNALGFRKLFDKILIIHAIVQDTRAMFILLLIYISLVSEPNRTLTGFEGAPFFVEFNRPGTFARHIHTPDSEHTKSILE